MLQFLDEEIPFKTLIYIDSYGEKINIEIHSSVQRKKERKAVLFEQLYTDLPQRNSPKI